MTGSNRGIGLEMVKHLAEKTPKDARIYAGCRTPEGSNAQVGMRLWPPAALSSRTVATTSPRSGQDRHRAELHLRPHGPLGSSDVPPHKRSQVQKLKAAGLALLASKNGLRPGTWGLAG